MARMVAQRSFCKIYSNTCSICLTLREMPANGEIVRVRRLERDVNAVFQLVPQCKTPNYAKKAAKTNAQTAIIFNTACLSDSFCYCRRFE